MASRKTSRVGFVGVGKIGRPMAQQLLRAGHDLLVFDTDDELRRQQQIGFDQADRGQLVDWDPQRIKDEGRRRLRQRSDA